MSTSSSSPRGKRAVAGSVAAAVALSGLALAAAPAQAAETSTVRIQYSELGKETTSYPANKWFVGSSNLSTIGVAIENEKLILNRKTQLLTELKGAEKPESVVEIVEEGLSADVADGSASGVGLQIALGWPGSGNWTTLRPAVNEDAAALDQQWISSRPLDGIVATNGAVQGTLGELAASIDGEAQGEFAYVAVGIFADSVLPENATDTTTVVDSITVDDTKYVFADGLRTVTKTTKVQLDEFGVEGTSYPDDEWFFGTSSATTPATVSASNLVLPVKTQILHELTGDEKPTKLRSVVADGLAVTVPTTSAGRAWLQIAAGWEGGWTTLRPATPTTGVNAATFDQNWVLSRAVDGVTEGTLGELVALVDTAADGSFGYVAVGAFADNLTGTGAASVSAFQVGTEKFTFADEAKLVASGLIEGERAVGNTLTATYTANYGGTTAKYQWLRDGKAISRATASTYTLKSNDRTTRISVKVTLSKSGFKAIAFNTPRTAAIAYGTLTFAAPAQIAGTPKLGVKLTASALGFGEASEQEASAYAYAWYRDGVVIKGASASTYTPVFADLDKVITVKVVAKLSGYLAASAFSVPGDSVAPGTLTALTPTITGTAKVGSTLSVRTGTWVGTPTIKVAWFADGELIQLSSSKTLELTWEYKGAVITAESRASKQGYAPLVSSLSTATATVK